MILIIRPGFGLGRFEHGHLHPVMPPYRCGGLCGEEARLTGVARLTELPHV
jgi:hypothetical protein